ncbi:hypothetical protein AV530_003918 [Patagioenas fasciata monilis]|uniref:Uncharacterized protein n=1 Tax=Patagioenas fasciata monilis TaxID=372326 RepID=A0A1V4KZ76_PATFA|nr:hypothetical protein AV530_003918 [Patagioenas fasciata monilis]
MRAEQGNKGLNGSKEEKDKRTLRMRKAPGHSSVRQALGVPGAADIVLVTMKSGGQNGARVTGALVWAMLKI